jgi:hypothetical protein
MFAVRIQADTHYCIIHREFKIADSECRFYHRESSDDPGTLTISGTDAKKYLPQQPRLLDEEIRATLKSINEQIGRLGADDQ